MRSYIAGFGLFFFTTCLLPQSFGDDISLAQSSVVASQNILDAEKAGLIDVKCIPNDSRSAQIIVDNKSDQPLTLRLPKAFVGVPVLAQQDPNQVGTGGVQTTGGGMFGMNGMNGMGGPGGMGGGMFSVPPEKTKVVKVATVCLEYGKREPSPRMAYRLAALESFSDDPALAVLLDSFGRGEIPPNVAQAAAWNISSGLPWPKLAAEVIDRSGGARDQRVFTQAELFAARQVVGVIQKRVSNMHKTSSHRSSGEQ